MSIVVLTRNGRPHLERLLVGLRDRTRYRSFELLVVDNASTDGTDLMLREDWGFPIRIIRNEENTSFSEGNNQGIAQARGDLILLLNNDVDPINEGWLGAMVEGLRSESKTLAVGALLVYPRRKKGQRDPDQTDLDLTVQHRGIAFVWEAGAPRAVNLGRGEDPLNPDLVGMRVVPAVTAACLLVSKQKLTGVGGLTEGYVFGTEDVDLCLKLRDLGGEILYCGQAALFHHEFGSQETIASELKRAARLGNACRFRERWTPRLARSMRIDQLTRGGRWTEPGPRVVGITVTRDDPKDGFGDWYTAHGLGAALAKLGWKVWYLERHNDNWRELPDRLDLLVSLLPQFDPSWAPEGCFTIAWVRNWVDRWLENPAFSGFDLVVAATEAFARRVAAATEHEPIILPLAADPGLFRPTEPVPALHCDYTFTANRWGGDRPILNHLDVDPDETFLLFGKGWEEIPRVARYWRGFLDYQQLPLLYSSTKIVVDDTVPPNKPALNGRVFEALASGALVITDNVEGSEEVFGGRLPTYRSRQELRYQLDRYLGDGALREATAEELRGVVLADHTYEIRAQRFIERSRSQLLKPKVAIKIGPPDQVVAERWGDTHFARAFAKALRALDFSTQIHILPEWDAPQLQDCDVVVHLRGLTPYVPKLGHLNVLWIISHPADVTPRECERFDLVLVASETFAEELREQIDTPVHVLHQATDPDRFREVPADPDLRCRVLFVGNSRRQVRPAVQWAIEQGAPLHLYGAEWEDLIDSSYVKGPYFPNERLNELYCSAEIVLNDHWPDMAESGFVSNRIYDALACGAFIITDPVDGLEDLFEETVPTFSNKEELQELLERYGKDPEERQRLSALGRQIVVSRHSFQVRAREFVEIIRQSLGQRSLTMEVPARAEGSNAP
ncbi:MAG: glycosyltransferase family protein [Acidimicrobiia bacterium]